MADRRSLSDAMTLNPTQNAFIHGDQVPMQNARESKQSVREAALDAQASASVPASPEPGSPTKRRGRPPQEARVSTQIRPEPPVVSKDLDFAPILVSLTTRLSPATAEALRRATLEQKLQRRRPHTQQDIVESAVRHWLKTNGFLKAA